MGKYGVAVLILVSVLVSGCATSVNNPIVTNKRTSKVLAAGVASGAAVGTIGSGGNPAGGLLGAIVGGYANSKQALASRLQHMGAQVIQVGDTISILIPADSVFGPKTDQLKHAVFYQDQPILDLTSHFLNKFGNSVVKVAVSTDDIGSVKDNYYLSSRQADMIAAYLYHHGVNAWRLYPVFYGPHNLLATNRTVMGSYHNRMVEITTNPNITAADCCHRVAHFLAKIQPWQ